MLNRRLPKLKYHTRPEQLRKELEISQVEAARILGVSKNTWIRWEKGKPFDKAALEFLESLAERRIPTPCETMKTPKKLDWNQFDEHVRFCKKCARLVKYLAAVVKEKKVLTKESSTQHVTPDYTPRAYRKRVSV